MVAIFIDVATIGHAKLPLALTWSLPWVLPWIFAGQRVLLCCFTDPSVECHDLGLDCIAIDHFTFQATSSWSCPIPHFPGSWIACDDAHSNVQCDQVICFTSMFGKSLSVAIIVIAVAADVIVLCMVAPIGWRWHMADAWFLQISYDQLNPTHTFKLHASCEAARWVILFEQCLHAPSMCF